MIAARGGKIGLLRWCYTWCTDLTLGKTLHQGVISQHKLPSCVFLRERGKEGEGREGESGIADGERQSKGEQGREVEGESMNE